MYTIFVGTDFSKTAGNAIMYAIALAQKTNGNLILFHECSNISNCEKKLKEDCEKIEQAYKIACKYVITRMSGTKGLIHKAMQNKADIIIVGITEGPKLKKNLFGSMTQQLIKAGSLPVMVIPENIKYKDINKLVLAIDSMPDYDVIQSLADFASRLNAKVDIVHINENNSVDSDVKVEKVIKKTGYSNITYTLIKGKDIAKELDEYLNKENGSVLAIIKKNSSYMHHFFTGIAGKMTLKFRAPVLVYKEEEINIGPLEVKAEEILG